MRGQTVGGTSTGSTHHLVRAVAGVIRERSSWWLPDPTPKVPVPQPLGWMNPLPRPMPTWPTPEGRRCITLDLATEHVEHLDSQAAYYGCTRVAYIRRLIVDDIRRQAKAAA